jgi:hypothetical protein
MEAGLDTFIKAYAVDSNLPEVTVALFAGAMSHKAIEKLDEYKRFVVVLNQVAPQLIGYIENLGSDNK